jgi:hypothetical protein
MRLSHANHSIYKGLIALLRGDPSDLRDLSEPDQEEPFQELKKLPQLKPKRKDFL